MFTSATSAYMKPFERVRRQWLAFEQWLETGPRVEMERGISEKFHDMDAKWNATPLRTRPSRQDHDKNKTAFRRETEDGLVTIAREEWQRRLEAAGLKDEDWGEMTFKETLAVERLLGGDLDEEGMAIMESVARAEEAEVMAPHLVPLPRLSNATRSSNFSGYSFVSPMSLSIGDELDDETDAFESIFPYEVPPSSGPESITDDIFDAPTSVPRGWKGDAHSYGIWSADTSQSSRQSSQTGSPERLPPKPMPAEHAFFPRIADPVPAHPESRSTATIRARKPVPSYIGPVLTAPVDNEALEEEAEEFERFKMETRVAKIREFHEEAARADIQLAQDIYNARKSGGNARDDERKIAEHQKRMLELQRTKEEERKAVVRAERAVRLEAIEQRKKQVQPKPKTVVAEPPRDLAQEVGAKLRLSGFVATPDLPVVPVMETRRGRRQSQSTMSATSSQSSRQTAAPAPDRLAPSVPDLLSTLSSTSSTTSSTPVSSASTSSSQPPTQWLPGAFPEVTTTTPPTKAGKKKGAPAATPVNVSASASTKKQQGQKSTSDTSNKPSPIVAEPPLISSAVPTLSAAPPPTATKQPVSSASKAKTASVPAKSKGPSPPVTSKASATTAAVKTQPSPPSKTQAPSPPSVKTHSPPAPPVETPKPTPPVSALPQKKARAAATVDMPIIQTPGASSSRTTLEQIQRPFMHKSLGHDAEGWVDPGARPFNGCIPHPTVPGRGTKWVSSSSAAAGKVSSASASSMSTSSVSSASSQIEKTISMPQPRLPQLATTRARRMSDPISPSPRGFAFAEGVQDTVPAPGILKAANASAKGKGKGKGKRVTIEEVSDEEEADELERLPVDSKVIFEPKPSVPQTMFSSIIDFAPQPRSALASDDGRGEAKHVRWTPSTVGGANPAAARASGMENVAVEVAPQAAVAGKKGQRSRASSLLQTSAVGAGAGVDRKGKGKERAVPQPQAEGDDEEFARFMMGATQNLAQGR
ncbi:hypothetical protein C8R46DRAFT_1358112 [Mycena filopes]|nr:hypothetical protein C8R46DRAFT_1358112 [Mycena filopes]